MPIRQSPSVRATPTQLICIFFFYIRRGLQLARVCRGPPSKPCRSAIGCPCLPQVSSCQPTLLPLTCGAHTSGSSPTSHHLLPHCLCRQSIVPQRAAALGKKFQLPPRRCNWPLRAMRRGGRAACRFFPRSSCAVRGSATRYALASAAAALGRVGSHAPTAWGAAREEGGLPTAGAPPHSSCASARTRERSAGRQRSEGRTMLRRRRQ
jgi:hypothetical protein